MWVIDFEASGLSKQSYPIEVGLTNGSTEYQSLIKPMQHWLYWSYASGAVHKIKRAELLTDGTEALKVAQRLNELATNQIVYCHSVQWDGFWCNALFSDNGIKCAFEIRDIQELIADSDSTLEAFLNAQTILQSSQKFTAHRALDDALVIWKALTAALKK